MLLEGRPRAAARRKNRWSASRTWAINAGQPGGSEQCHRRAGLGTGLRRMKAKAREHLSHLRVGKSERVHARTQRRGALAPEPLLDHAHVPRNMLSQVSRKALVQEEVVGTHLSPPPRKLSSYRTGITRPRARYPGHCPTREPETSIPSRGRAGLGTG